MNRQTRPPSVFSKVSVKSQTVIPREVRERLQLKPGDTLRYRLTGEGVLLDKAGASDGDDRSLPSQNGQARRTRRHMATSEAARFDPFDVVIVPFPYADRLAEKRRPAIVISNRKLALHGVIWVAMITSAENERWSTDVAITDLSRAGLPAPSVGGRQRSHALIPAGSIAAWAGSTGQRLAA